MIFREALTYDDIQIVPRYSEVENRTDCNISTRFTKNYNIKIPYVSAPMDTVTGGEMAIGIMKNGGVGCVHRFMSIDEQVDIVKDIVQSSLGAGYPICVSIGVKDYEERLSKVVEAGANVILIDVAHGNTKLVKNTIKYIKENYLVDVIAGNVATGYGARNLCEWGADAVRVGIGNGCIVPHMLVKTNDGLKKISDIELGDMVYTYKGELKEVIDVLTFYKDEEIMVINDIEVTKNHEFFVIDKLDLDKIENDDDVEKYGLWIESKELNDNYLLVDVSCV